MKTKINWLGLVRKKLLLTLLFFTVLGMAQNNKMDSLKKLLLQPRHDTLQIKTLNIIGFRYLNSGSFDSGYKYLRRSYSYALKTNYKRGLANSANRIGQYYIYQGMYDSSFYYFDISAKNFLAVGDSNDLGTIYNNTANAYKAQGNIPKALENYFKSLDINEKRGRLASTANVCTNLGNLYGDFKDSANALKFLMKGLRLREQVGDSADIGNSYTALGLHYNRIGNYPKALSYHFSALKILERTDDKEGEAIANYNIAEVLFNQKNFNESEKYFLKALAYAEENNDLQGLSSCLESLGTLKLQANDVDAAIRYYERAMVVGQQTGIAELQASISEALSDSYEQKGDFKKALMYYKNWNKLHDSIFNLANVQKLTSTELKYEHEKERLRMLAEQQQKDLVAKEESFKKTVVLISIIIFLILVSVFAVILYRRLQVNRLQKSLIEEQNHEIVDSIKYAKRIQNALFTKGGTIKKYFDDSFIFFKPKDIVSGDFYWATTVQSQEGELFYLAVCDSTGHGVPGAFMSLLNIGYLNEAIVEKGILQPNEVLNYVRKRLIDSISGEDQSDGMDGILFCFNRSKNIVTYAAANNSPVVAREKEVIELPFDKMPVGKGERIEGFTQFTFPAKKGDYLYLYSDGYADQFGGPKGKKFKYKQLNDLLGEISNLSPDEQSLRLDRTFEQWRGRLEQVDDVVVLGLKV